MNILDIWLAGGHLKVKAQPDLSFLSVLPAASDPTTRMCPLPGGSWVNLTHSCQPWLVKGFWIYAMLQRLHPVSGTTFTMKLGSFESRSIELADLSHVLLGGTLRSASACKLEAKEFFAPLLSNKQMWLLRWMADRIFVGLRLFWHARGRNKWLGLWLWAALCMDDNTIIGSAARGWIGGLCLGVSLSLAAVGFSYASLRGCLQAYRKLRAYAINERQDAQFKGCCLFFAMLGASVITCIIFAFFINLTDPSVCVASPSGFLHPNNFLLPCTVTVLWVQKSFDSTLGFPGEGPTPGSPIGSPQADLHAAHRSPRSTPRRTWRGGQGQADMLTDNSLPDLPSFPSSSSTDANLQTVPHVDIPVPASQDSVFSFGLHEDGLRSAVPGIQDSVLAETAMPSSQEELQRDGTGIAVPSSQE